MKKLLLPIVLLLSIGAGCTPAEVIVPPKDTTITYYTLAAPNKNTTFCDGATMNSVGYKNAMTTVTTTTVPGVLPIEEIVKTTLVMAAAKSDFVGNDAYTRIASTTFEGGVVTMHSASGWAGSSIFQCAWQPFVEKNVLGIPGVTQIKWDFQQ